MAGCQVSVFKFGRINIFFVLAKHEMFTYYMYMGVLTTNDIIPSYISTINCNVFPVNT